MSKVYDAKITDFKQDARNANRGTERGKGMLDESISRLGFGRPILADKNRTLIAGNHAAQAVAEAGLTDAIVVETDGTRPIIHVRTDLDLNEKKGRAREMSFADNQTSALNLSWDVNEVMAHSDLHFSPKFDTSDVSEAPENEEINVDELETKHECPRCKFQF